MKKDLNYADSLLSLFTKVHLMSYISKLLSKGQLDRFIKYLKASKILRTIKSSYVFMAFAGRRHRRNIVLPKSFNLGVHLTKYPPENYGFADSRLKFSEDKIYYFLSLLSTIPARNKDLIDESGWIPINIAKVKHNIKDIVQYKNYLVNTNVLECNNLYIPGVRSCCYRWSESYFQSGFHVCNVICSHEEDVYFIEKVKEENYSDLPYLYHWYNENKLEINPIALKYAESILNYMMRDRSRWAKNTHTGKLKHPMIQYMALLINIGKIGRKQYEIHIDSTVHRLHSVITNIQKDYRNFLSYEGQELVNIDIKNSQPYLACVLLQPEFWSINSEVPLNLFSLPEDIQRSITVVGVNIKVIEFLQSCAEEDFNQYKEQASRGIMYESIVDVCSKELHETINRGDAKTLVFYLLFSSNQGQSDNKTINKMKAIFSSELFPKVAELIKIIKHRYKNVETPKQHNRLACLLQSIESEIILHRCCKRIWEEGNHQVPVFTIHDSIATTVEHVEYVKRIMAEELSRAIGVSPILSIEHWNQTKLEYPTIYASTTEGD